MPARSLPKWSAFESNAALEYCRAARSETTVRETSMAMTAITTANTHQAASTSVSITPVSLSTANAATLIDTSTSTAASASAARCSALPWPYGWLRSAGLTATPTAKNVSNAATRSVPECTASETRPRLPLARPVVSLSPMSAQAAATETSAVRRCGVTAEG